MHIPLINNFIFVLFIKNLKVLFHMSSLKINNFITAKERCVHELMLRPLILVHHVVNPCRISFESGHDNSRLLFERNTLSLFKAEEYLFHEFLASKVETSAVASFFIDGFPAMFGLKMFKCLLSWKRPPGDPKSPNNEFSILNWSGFDTIHGYFSKTLNIFGIGSPQRTPRVPKMVQIEKKPQKWV